MPPTPTPTPTPTEGPSSKPGLTNVTTDTTASAKPTTGTEKGLSSKPSPSYKRNILDISKFSVFLHYLLLVV